jgi:hypothetical protein
VPDAAGKHIGRAGSEGPYPAWTAGSIPAVHRGLRQDISRLPIADQLAAMRSCGGAIYIVAHKAKMVDRRDGGTASDP